MQKIVLITGATDGIGLEAAKMLATDGHHVIVHGRNPSKLKDIETQLLQISTGKIESIQADLSSFTELNKMILEIKARFSKLDVLINNAGVYKTDIVETSEGLDVRFMVNSIAPYLLTKELIPLFDNTGRIINLSSAAQASVNLKSLIGGETLSDSEAYAQSKLALTMWSREFGLYFKDKGPMIVAVNPKSFLGSKMVKEAYGVAGEDISLGANILVRAALSDEFNNAHGEYFDNDIEAFSEPHKDALDPQKSEQIVGVIEAIISKYSK